MPIFFDDVGAADMSAIFLANRSISIATNFSFFLFAPGRLLRDLCLILPSCASPTAPVPNPDPFPSATSGNASPNDPIFVFSFLLGRRRLLILLPGADFVIRSRRVECLEARLSALLGALLDL